MRNRFVQMSLEDIYNNVTLSLENKNSNLVSLLEEHIHVDEFIPYSFKSAFYNRMDRSHIYHLDSFLWFLILKKSFTLADNKSFKSVSLKADIFLSGIIQLIGVILADKLHKPQFVKSIRKLIA